VPRQNRHERNEADMNRNQRTLLLVNCVLSSNKLDFM